MPSNEIRRIVLGLERPIIDVLKTLPPLHNASVSDITNHCYPGPKHTRPRNLSVKKLSRLLGAANYFKPQRSTHLGALVCYRWTALLANNPPQMELVDYPLNNIQLMILYPKLSEKIKRLGTFQIIPPDLNDFLTGMHAWEPIIKKRKHRYCKSHSREPGERGQLSGHDICLS